MEQKKSGIKKGFAIVNIIMGMILSISCGILFVEANVIGGSITAVLGLTLLIVGSYALYFSRKQSPAEEPMQSDAIGETRTKRVKLINTICFVVSCLLLAMVIILPIIGPML